MAVRSRAAGGAESAEKQRLAEGPGNASLCASEALCVSRSPAPRAASRPGSPRGPAASRGVSESRRHTFQVSEKARSATARDRPVTQNAPGFPEPCAKQRAWSGPCEHPRACAALCQAKELAAIRGSSRQTVPHRWGAERVARSLARRPLEFMSSGSCGQLSARRQGSGESLPAIAARPEWFDATASTDTPTPNPAPGRGRGIQE